MSDPERRPWEYIAELADAGARTELEAFIAELPPTETARAIANLTPEQQTKLLTLLDPVGAAEILEEIPDVQAAGLVEQLPPSDAAAIVSELPSDQKADLLSELEEDEAEAILAEMPAHEAEEARQLASYAPHEAGGLMVTEYVSYPDTATAQDVADDLRRNAERYSRYDIQYAYVVSKQGRLAGVVPLRALLLAQAATPVRELMVRDPHSVELRTSLDELHDFFERHRFYGAPVLGRRARLVGVVRRADVEGALADRTELEHLRTKGIVGGEELRTLPIGTRSLRRLSWLSANILLNILAASVIALYQDTLSAVIALAVFLPIISDMSGCSGSQAVAVSLRELTLGLIKPLDAARVWLKEISVGLINGAALGVLLALAALLWKGNLYLGLVVGVAMATNTVVAVSMGGVIPLLLRSIGRDPALASGPLLTTVTDICGFSLLLGLATLFLPQLAGT